MSLKSSVRRSFIQFELRFIARKLRSASMSMMPAQKLFMPLGESPSTWPWKSTMWPLPPPMSYGCSIFGCT